EAIEVTGLKRLFPSYVRDRIAVGTPKPLNINQLVDSLRLLQLDPLIASINAELEAGTRPGQNILRVVATEAKTFQLGIAANNNAVESVGTFQYVPFVSEANVSGRGDAISVNYQGTQGSNVQNFSYTAPINARNGTLALSFQNSDSTVIQPPFDELDIKVTAWTLDFTYRQPMVRSAAQEAALGVTFTRSQSQSTVLGLPIPISAGANNEGQTRLSVLRFFQDYLRRGAQDVLAVRSQFSFGLNLFDATINPEPPDALFFAWRGQAQYAYQLAPQTLFLVRGDVQVADRALPAVEQFSLGGQQSVRGYSQDFLITDNGALLSAEVRVPLWRSEDGQSVFQIVPFTDVGVGWNNSGFPDPRPNLIAGAGIGLNFELTERFSLRLDYGIPLVAVRTEDNTWQDNGIYFTVQFSPFRGW
ncbi:MAG: ShlB/FhaC/HecB family hemolysin secretion/activation protein, partial [Gloeomargaritaceae cyanobacterium C42_A2020_066]|nr:ShlB/FhaC/HecB family hemolysin secretion/activation protein [Gloeomargaritaceae cyanobacterium C42_A2020_066]